MATLASLSSLEEALTYFDSLPAVAEEEMLGEWDGGLVATGHPGEGQLGALGWIGKTFTTRDVVSPIIVRGAGGEREVSEVLGTASLRMVEYRGVVTATMVYDRHAIFDHFRRVSDDTVLGVMDRKGEDAPLVFFLTRTSAPA